MRDPKILWNESCHKCLKVQCVQCIVNQCTRFPSHLTGQQLLSVDDLCAVQTAVWELRAKWYNIGVALGISVGTLNATELKHHYNPDRCLTDVLTEWLRQGKPQPTWDALCEALTIPQIAS